MKDRIIKFHETRVELGANLSTSNYDLQTDEEKVKVYIKKEPVNEDGPEHLNDGLFCTILKVLNLIKYNNII